MLKFSNYAVTFAEVPDEISLCINITGCQIHCEGCHSQFLWKDFGTSLDSTTLKALIKQNKGITCVCFMGGDHDVKTINDLAYWIRLQSDVQLKTAWYSGLEDIHPDIDLSNFDYIKIGPYKKDLGGLDNPNTNQRMFEISHIGEHSFVKDITCRFWKNYESEANKETSETN